eukprot:scaffold5323_cov173-Amphora_coffeaeformis.AAC.3
MMNDRRRKSTLCSLFWISTCFILYYLKVLSEVKIDGRIVEKTREEQQNSATDVAASLDVMQRNSVGGINTRTEQQQTAATVAEGASLGLVLETGNIPNPIVPISSVNSSNTSASLVHSSTSSGDHNDNVTNEIMNGVYMDSPSPANSSAFNMTSTDLALVENNRPGNHNNITHNEARVFEAVPFPGKNSTFNWTDVDLTYRGMCGTAKCFFPSVSDEQMG